MKIITETENLVVQLADWKGEAAQLWSFTCSLDFLIFRQTKGGMGNTQAAFLCFAGCEEISTPTGTKIGEVEHYAIDKGLKCFRSGKISIIQEWWSLQDTDPNRLGARTETRYCRSVGVATLTDRYSHAVRGRSPSRLDNRHHTASSTRTGSPGVSVP